MCIYIYIFSAYWPYSYSVHFNSTPVFASMILKDGGARRADTVVILKTSALC